MTAYKGVVGKEVDKGFRKIFDNKSIIGRNATRIYTRAPQLVDHFLDSNTIRATAWVATETGAGTGKAVFVATTAADGGTAVGTAGATSGNAEELGWALAQFKPSTMALQRPLTFETRVKASTAASTDAFFGLHKINTSTGTAGRLAIVSAASALSGVTASDEFAGFAFSSTASSGGLNGAVGGVTVKAGTGTVTALSGAPADLTANHVYRVEVDVNGSVYWYIDDKFYATANAAVTASVALLPYFDIVNTASANTTLTIDYAVVGGDLA